MEKKHIVKFLKHKKRGVYPLIVELYSDVITSMAVTMALEVITEDLENVSGETVKLNYYSLAQAAAKFKKDMESKPAEKKGTNRFKDANELEEKQTKPGGFKVPQ